MTSRTKRLIEAAEYERKMLESDDPKVRRYYEAHMHLAMQAAYASTVAIRERS